MLTNSPGFEWQMTNLNNYVNLYAGGAEAKPFGKVKLAAFGAGSGFLGIPGDVTPPSRFVRAAFYQTSSPMQATARKTVLQAFQILNNFDIPVGIEFADAKCRWIFRVPRSDFSHGYDRFGVLLPHHVQQQDPKYRLEGHRFCPYKVPFCCDRRCERTTDCPDYIELVVEKLYFCKEIKTMANENRNYCSDGFRTRTVGPVGQGNALRNSMDFFEYTVGRLGGNTLYIMECGIGKVNAAVGASD